MLSTPVTDTAGHNSGARALGRFPYAAGVVAVLALGAALRLQNLGAWSYWSDEAFTISDSNAIFLGGDNERLPAHRLAFLLYGAWFQWARSLGIPFSETVARILPALFGVVGVACTAWLGARAAGRSGALFGGLLVALSPFHLYWSQNARSYALEVVLAIPAALLLGSACWRWKAQDFLLGLALLAAAAFAHPTALTLAPGIVAFFAYARTARTLPGTKSSRLWLAAGGMLLLAAIAISPLGRSLWVHFKVKSGGSPVLFLTTCIYYFRPTLLAAALFLGIRAWLRRDAPGIFLAFVGFGALASGFAASLLVRTNAQYVVAALPFLALLVGREIVNGARSMNGGRALAVALAAALTLDFAGGAFLYHTSERGHRAPWREACELVWREAGPDDLLISTQSTVVECYLNPANPLPRDPSASIYVNRFEPDKFEVAARLRRRTWLLILDVDLAEWRAHDRAKLWQFLKEECRLVADFPLQFAGKDQTLRVWRFDPN